MTKATLRFIIMIGSSTLSWGLVLLSAPLVCAESRASIERTEEAEIIGSSSELAQVVPAVEPSEEADVPEENDPTVEPNTEGDNAESGRLEEDDSVVPHGVTPNSPVRGRVTPDGVAPARVESDDREVNEVNSENLNSDDPDSDDPNSENPESINPVEPTDTVGGDITEEEEEIGNTEETSAEDSSPSTDPTEDTDAEDSAIGDSDLEDTGAEEIGDSNAEDSNAEDSAIEDSNAEEIGDSDLEDTDAEDSEIGDSDAEDTNAEEIGDSDPEDTDEDELTAEDLERRRLLIEGDRLWLAGRFAEAEALYRQAKDPFYEEGEVFEEGFSDPEQLSPAGRVYWREYQAGAEMGLDTRIRIPLDLLLETEPEFVPGHVAYAQVLIEAGELDEALVVLERATALYPHDSDLAKVQVDTFVADEQWLQAAIAARQFALLNPDNPEAPAFETQAEEYQDRFRSKMRRRLTRAAIGNVITGAVGFAVTGSWFGPLSALETTLLMLRGESSVGERVAKQAAEELDLITDETVVNYVNEMGQELAALAGRDEFEYRFYVVAEDQLNAFALPGGKIFVNAGAITRTETGAELAGLVAHELAHAVLSHGFQLVTRGNLTANVLQFIPYGGLVSNLTVLSYSRDMERQADTLGTQLLATSPYAADGLRNLMQTLWEESETRSRFDWLSTHPDTPERIRNMERLIERNGFNRYAFENIEEHLVIRARVEQILCEMDKIDLDIEVETDESENESSENGDSANEGDTPNSESADCESDRTPPIPQASDAPQDPGAPESSNTQDSDSAPEPNIQESDIQEPDAQDSDDAQDLEQHSIDDPNSVDETNNADETNNTDGPNTP